MTLNDIHSKELDMKFSGQFWVMFLTTVLLYIKINKTYYVDFEKVNVNNIVKKKSS